MTFCVVWRAVLEHFCEISLGTFAGIFGFSFGFIENELRYY